ncbi:MAG: hypothetical protein N3I35_08465 [Clostridia bacterium]|nr:hypothetical protein [Clostridia bacterium]
MTTILEYLIIIILIICVFFIYMYLNKKRNLKALKRKLVEQWASEPGINYSPNEIESIAD